MNKQQGSAHAILVIVLVVGLLGALGFIFWQNFIKDDDSAASTKQAETTEKVEAPVDNDQLRLKELGLTLQTENAKYDDITYVMTSVNKDDSNKYVTAIYSKDLNDRLVADAKKVDSSSDFDDLYVRYSANRAVYAYYYGEPADSMMPDMIDGVASNIIDPTKKTAISKLYVGFMGPGSYSTNELSDEMMAFRDWIIANVK